MFDFVMELCRALGVHPKGVTKLTLEITEKSSARLILEKEIFAEDDEELRSIIERHRFECVEGACSDG